MLEKCESTDSLKAHEANTMGYLIEAEKISQAVSDQSLK